MKSNFSEQRKHMQNLLLTGGSKITCLRCTARSSRTGLQCGRPALKVSKTQKCQFHGGRGSGPKTTQGRARIAAAQVTHGNATKVARADYSASSLRLSRYEDALRVLGMTDQPRARGRKAAGYVPIRTLDEVRDMVTHELMHSEKEGRGRPEKI